MCRNIAGWYNRNRKAVEGVVLSAYRLRTARLLTVCLDSDYKAADTKAYDEKEISESPFAKDYGGHKKWVVARNRAFQQNNPQVTYIWAVLLVLLPDFKAGMWIGVYVGADLKKLKKDLCESDFEKAAKLLVL